MKKTRKAEHNIGSHKEKMVKRRALRGLRVRIPYKLGYHFKTGKYTPKGPIGRIRLTEPETVI